MKSLFLFFSILCLLATSSFATYVAVLETGADGSAKDNVSLSDRQYLTNVLREQAVKELPAVQNYTIMTRENIQQMLPPGKAIEDCEGSCLVETGKNIAADYICQARVGMFGTSLTLSAELYETAGNKLIASFNGRGANVEELLDLIKQKSPEFFRQVKGGGGFAGVGGIGAIGNTGSFSYGGKQKFIVEITSTPAGAVPTIDGKAVPKCLSTPCKVQVEEGNHRIVASFDRYEDAETLVDIKSNNQKVELTLTPNFGWLEMKPVLAGPAAKRGVLNVTVDGVRKDEQKIDLEAGMHKVLLTHPCYDPAEFNVSIAKNKTEIFNQEIPRGKGGLELNVEYKGEPQAVAVVIDGVEVGSTPYAGEVPLCAEVMLKGDGWTEKVNVQPKWHEVVQVTHKLSHTPEGVAVVGDVNANGNAKQDQASDAASDAAQGGKGKKIHWIPIAISGGVAVVGGAMAFVFNKKAKDATATPPRNQQEFQKGHDDAKKNQTLRNVSLGLMAAGLVGVGVTFLF
ncbi:MAG: PEGA domain-containing protein [Fibrobacter sp.]|nr:PEGA domain-containing protein [Fibrobacter sp.]